MSEIVCHSWPTFFSRTDNGPQFISDHFKRYLEKISQTTQDKPHPYGHTPMPGEIERQNRTILKRLRIAQAEGRDWRL